MRVNEYDACQRKTWNSNPWHLNVLILAFGSILLLTFWIRIQGTSRIPNGQFTGHDAYLYYWQAHIISEHGQLPPRDMYRWLPLGRDLGQTLNLYSYALAYVHKLIVVCLPNVSLYDVCVYAPPVCFVIALGSLCLFLYYTHGFLFSSIVGVLLATLPGAIGRSSAGFGDRDSWCFLLAVLATTTYIASLQAHTPRERIYWTLVSGSTVFLGGLSWEAFGLFVAIILAVELWRFCSTERGQHLKEYALWLFLFVPWIYLVSHAYRKGYGFATHVPALMIFSPIVVFVIRSVKYLLLDFSERFLRYARQLAWLLTLSGIAIGVCYIVINLDNLAFTAYPFRENRLMRSIEELANPQMSYWIERYGSIFILGSLGFIIESLRVWKWRAVPLSAALILFFTTTFFRYPVSRAIGMDGCNMLFFTSLVLVPLGLGIANLRKKEPKNELITLTAIVWALVWIGLAREGKRYNFFIGVPLAFGTASLLCWISAYLKQKLMVVKKLNPYVRHRWVTACITIALFVPILLWPAFGGHATYAIKRANHVREPVPGRGEIAATFQWMSTALPQNSIVAANWEHGSQLNVLGGVKTIIDQDHYIPHWIHLYYRHVFCAQSEQEALSFLKTHGVTHLMLTQKEIITFSGSHSFIGSNEKGDRHFRLSKLRRDRINSTETHYRMIPYRGTPLDFVEIAVLSPAKRSVTVHLKTQDPVSKNIMWDANKPVAIRLGESGVILYFDFEGKPYTGYYIPPLGWNSLAVKLFMQNEQSSTFVPIYLVNEDDIAKTQVWEIHYPPDIKPNPKYLKTEIPEIEAQLQALE